MGADVFQAFTPDTGITYKNAIVKYAMVAHWDNLSYDDFRNKSIEYQSMMVALFDVIHRAEAVKAWKERPKPSKK